MVSEPSKLSQPGVAVRPQPMFTLRKLTAPVTVDGDDKGCQSRGAYGKLRRA